MRTYAPAAGTDMNQNDLIISYFNIGYTNKEILAALVIIQSIKLSVHQLKRILAKSRLRRNRGNFESPYEKIVEAMIKKLNGSGRCLGYRAMWKHLVRCGLHVYHNTVLELPWILVLEGVKHCKSKRCWRRKYGKPGPNHLWYIDRYDKFKQFRFTVYEAIREFCHKILWLEIGLSNNDPHVAKYYLDAITRLGYVLHIIHSDLSTENYRIKLRHGYFRQNVPGD